MIERILDNYFTKKLLEEIRWNFITKGLDYRAEDYGYEFCIKTKMPKYRDAFYCPITFIRKDEAFEIMCNLKEFKKELDKKIDFYLKNH